MNAAPFTDEQLAQALRSYLPSRAPNASADRLLEAIAEMPQQRTLPIVMAQLRDVDPIGRRRSVLIAAVLLTMAALIGGIAAGAFRPWLRDGPDDLSLRPPADVQAYAVSVLQDSPIVRPMSIDVMARAADSSFGAEQPPVRSRILMDGAGGVRIEHFASSDAAQPESFRIITAERMVELARKGAERVWVEEPFGSDPRGWIFDELAAYMPTADVSDCEMTEPVPVSGWRYVGLETVIGRPAHHIFCGGEFWIDAETRLILRSRGPLTPDGRPANDTTRTVEVTSLGFDEPRAPLFDLTRPAGLRLASRDEVIAYEESERQKADCAADPVCSADEVALATPPPAEDAERAATVEDIVAAARAAREAVPPIELAIERTRSRGGVVGTDRLIFERPDRFRIEVSEDRLAGQPAQTMIWDRASGVWATRVDDQGKRVWFRYTNARNIVDAGYMWLEGSLFSLPECGPPNGLAAGVAGPHWRLLGVDRVGDFVADHIDCADEGSTWTVDGEQYACGCAGLQFWIDRASHLVVRRLAAPDSEHGWTDAREVVSLRPATPTEDTFHPPSDAVIVVQPTPDPAASSSSPPSPAPSPASG